MSTIISITSNSKTHKLKMRFDIDKHTLRDVKQAIIDEIDSTRRMDTLSIIDAGRTLNGDNKTLRQLGTDDDDAEEGLNFFMATKLRGGAFAPNSSNVLDRNRQRSLKAKLPRSKQACCVYGNMLRERTEMPCGHAFSAQSMFDTMKAVIRGSRHKFLIFCPICRTEFPYKKAARVANLDAEERAYFSEEFSRRAFPMKTCPGCKSDCMRPDGLALFRVSCGGCAGGDWCWLCAGKWRRSGFTVCGNADCGSYKLNAMLMNCKTKKSQSTYNVEIPEYRACPKCATLIIHNDACKHMNCECGYKFCFVCLKAYENGKGWPCGSHRDQCPAAPRQQF